MPMWADDPVQRHVGCGGVEEGRGFPPPEVNQEAGIVGGAGQVKKYIKISNRA